MTLEEYAKEIGSELSAAYNSRNETKTREIFSRADTSLKNSSISEVSTRRFWGLVESEYGSGGRLLIERQEGSALHDLMREIEREIAARKGE